MVVVAGRQTRKLRGRLEKAPGKLCSTLIFFRGRMFWEETVCWQPDPPSGCGDLQRRQCWQLTFPLLLLCFCFSCWFFFPLTLQIPPPKDLLISSFFLLLHKLSHIQIPSQPYSSPFIPCTTPGGLTSIVYVGKWLRCAMVLTSLKKKNKKN